MDYPDEYKNGKNISIHYLTIQILELPEFNLQKKNFIISRRIMTEFLSIKSDEERLKKYKFTPLMEVLPAFIDISTNVNIGTPIIDIIRDGKKEVELNINNKDRKLISADNLVTLRWQWNWV